MKIDLGKNELIHFVGIGGIGMSGLALIMNGLGYKVQGSDIVGNRNIDKLKEKKIKVFLNQKEIDSENKELEKKYIKFFGSDAEKPPKHIMKTLVDMKENGTFEDKIKTIEKNYSSIKQKVEKSTGIKLSKDHPLFDIDFEKNGEE